MTEKQREITKVEIKFLRNLNVQLKHTVPKQHKIGKHYSMRLTKDEVIEFNKYHPMKSGKYTTEENNIIQKNWKSFCQTHDWDPEFTLPFTQMEYEPNKYYIPDVTNRTKFFQFLADGLLGRSLNSVYCHFNIIYNKNARRQNFSKDDDQTILKQMAELKTSKTKKNILKLAELLGKQPTTIARRYKYLMTSHPSMDNTVERRVIWNLELITTFLKHLLELTLSKNVKQLKNAEIPKYVFKQIEERMNINMADLQKLWWIELHLQLFSPKPIFINDLKIEIIKRLLELGPEVVTRIPYHTLSKQFDGTTPQLIKFLVNNSVNMPSMKREKRNVYDRIKTFAKKRFANLKMTNQNSYKCRLEYHKGKVRLHRDDERNLGGEVNSDSSDVESSIEDDLEDRSMNIDNDFSEPESILTDDILSEELYSDEDSSNSEEFETGTESEMETEIDNTNSEESLVSRMNMWEDVINGEVERTNSEKVESDVQFCAEFVNHLLDLMMSSSVEGLKNATIPDVVWEKLQDRMNVPKDQLRDYWLLQLHMQMFCPEHVYYNVIKRRIIEILYELRISTFADIQWSSLLHCFDGATVEFLQQVFDSVLVTVDENDIRTKSFLYILKQLYMKERNNASKATQDKRMKRFHYRIEKIKLIAV